jgi:hypothetical protein
MIVCVVSPALTVPGQFEVGDPPSEGPPELLPEELLVPELPTPELLALFVASDPLSREATELLPEFPPPELLVPELEPMRPPPEPDPELPDAPAPKLPEPAPPPELVPRPSELLASNSGLPVADWPHAATQSGTAPPRTTDRNAAVRGVVTFMATSTGQQGSNAHPPVESFGAWKAMAQASGRDLPGYCRRTASLA